MYLKFEYEGKEKYVELSSGKIQVGRGSQADVIIRAEGVSRMHLVFEQDDDGFFVTDLGSTNGTFINDVRLEPNKRTEFHSFFPVSMGGNVSISLVESEGEDDLATDPSALNISSSERTGEIHLDRSEMKPKRKKKDWSWMKALIPSFFLIIAFVGLSIFYVWWKGEEKRQQEVLIQSQNRPAPKPVPKPKKVEAQVNRRNIVQAIQSLDPILKCQTDLVTKLCREFATLRIPDRSEGFILYKDALFLMVSSNLSLANIRKNFELTLKDKNFLVSKFERLYPKGDNEEFQIKYNYQMNKPNFEVDRRAAMLFDFVRMETMKEVLKDPRIKSLIVLESTNDLSFGYKRIKKPYYLFYEKRDLESLLKSSKETLEALRYAILVNDLDKIKKIYPALLRGIKNSEVPIINSKPLKSFKKLN